MSTYSGPSYEFTASVINLRRLPRFGHGTDFTDVLSSDPDKQADYAAGLISLFVFLLIIFIFWTIAIVVFKIMGPGNAGFLSGYHFVVPDPADDEKNIYKRPLRVRVVFLIATATLMLFAFLFVVMGLTNVNNAAITMGKSLQTTEDVLQNVEQIASGLKTVGEKSIELRDAAVKELDNLCPNNPNVADAVGLDIVGIAKQAKDDLTMLANFISDGLAGLNENLSLVRGFTTEADKATEKIGIWGWEMKLLAAGLFVLPSFLVVGVGLAMLDVDVPLYQNSLTYFFMPLFGLTIVACYIVCCAILPLSATSADFCSGGGDVHGGPDDTILTVYRNLMGDDDGLIFKFMAFYTQQCQIKYDPFEFLKTYMNDLEKAVASTNDANEAMGSNQALLEAQCGRSFDSVLEIVDDMHGNLRLLKQQAVSALDLIKCENMNQLYVNTVHEAGCTYSVDAMAWTFACALIISVCGLIMIMLRSAYYPVEYLELGDEWTREVQTKITADSEDNPDPVIVRKLAHSPVPVRTVPQAIKVSQVNDDEFEMGHPVGEF